LHADDLADHRVSVEEVMSEKMSWLAGLGCVEVTPTESMKMAGYAVRKEQSDGVRDPLRAKALVIEVPRASAGC
jgi:hypothetical protein